MSQQLSLLDVAPRAPRKTEQAAQLSRVVSGIGHLVLTFCRERVGKQFHMSELLAYVDLHAGGYVAPGSPDRILRALRKGGRVRYTLLSRSESLYRVDAVKP